MSPVEGVAWVVAGFPIGAYTGAIGAGGGFLVTPALLLRFHESAPAEVTSASLAVVVITSVTASLLARREGRVDRLLALGMAILVVPAGLLGAATTAIVPRAPFALGFGAATRRASRLPNLPSRRQPADGRTRRLAARPHRPRGQPVPLPRAGPEERRSQRGRRVHLLSPGSVAGLSACR